MRAKTFEDYRELFLDCGLMYGRHFGSKSGYQDSNPGCVYIANACVYTRDGTCVWRGDLDLTSDDGQLLLDASKKMNRRLYVLREQTGHDHFHPQWMIRDALFTFWRGQAATTAFGARWHGTFEHMLQRRSKLDAAPRPRKRKSKDGSMAVGLRLLFGTEGSAATEAETDDGHLPHIPNAKTKAAMGEPTPLRFRSAKALSAEQMSKWIAQDEEAATAVKVLKRQQ